MAQKRCWWSKSPGSMPDALIWLLKQTVHRTLFQSLNDRFSRSSAGIIENDWASAASILSQKQVSTHVVGRGGSYRVGKTTCWKEWHEVDGARVEGTEARDYELHSQLAGCRPHLLLPEHGILNEPIDHCLTANFSTREHPS